MLKKWELVINRTPNSYIDAYEKGSMSGKTAVN